MINRRLVLVALFSAIFVVLIGVLAFGLVARKNKAHEFEAVTVNSIISNLSLSETGSIKVSEELFGVARGNNIKGIIRFIPTSLPVKSGIIAPKVSGVVGLNISTFEPLFIKQEDLKDRSILRIAIAEDVLLSGNFAFRLDYELTGLVLETESGKYMFFKQVWGHSTSIGSAKITLNPNHFDLSGLRAWIDLNDYIQVKAGDVQAFLPKTDDNGVVIQNDAIVSTRRLKPFESISLMAPIL